MEISKVLSMAAIEFSSTYVRSYFQYLRTFLPNIALMEISEVLSMAAIELSSSSGEAEPKATTYIYIYIYIYVYIYR
jgi:hypothetical protein